jgi:hypothetical protein
MGKQPTEEYGESEGAFKNERFKYTELNNKVQEASHVYPKTAKRVHVPLRGKHFKNDNSHHRVIMIKSVHYSTQYQYKTDNEESRQTVARAGRRTGQPNARHRLHL